MIEGRADLTQSSPGLLLSHLGSPPSRYSPQHSRMEAGIRDLGSSPGLALTLFVTNYSLSGPQFPTLYKKPIGLDDSRSLSAMTSLPFNTCCARAHLGHRFSRWGQAFPREPIGIGHSQGRNHSCPPCGSLLPPLDSVNSGQNGAQPPLCPHHSP